MTARTHDCGALRVEDVGKPVSMAGQSTEVVRRQLDGTWRYVVDNPYAVE